MRTEIPTYHYGNTIRLEVFFSDFDGNPAAIDTSDIKLVIYDERYNVIFDTSDQPSVPSDDPNKGRPIHADSSEVGKFYFDYTTPRKAQRIFYEWSGIIQEKISLKRGEFNTRFLR